MILSQINWEGQDRRILGVVKNMVMESPYQQVKPTVYYLEYGWAKVITIRINHNLSARVAISKIETVFKKIDLASPFDYHFSDEQYAQKYADEQRSHCKSGQEFANGVNLYAYCKKPGTNKLVSDVAGEHVFSSFSSLPTDE